MKRIVSTIVVFMLLFSAFAFVPGQIADAEETRALAFTEYLSYSDVKQKLIGISEDHSEITEFRIIGETYEGRDIMALRVTDNPDIEESEPDVLIMGGHHARELPSVEVPLYILDYLVEGYSSDGNVRKLVDTRDIWFVPLVNPDGREYVLNGTTSWRKNRRPIDTDNDGTPEGYGVDLNRNYGHLWGQLPGTSHSVNDYDYCGPSAFSENETQAIRDLAFGQLFEVSLSYHTFAEEIYHPWNNNIDGASTEADVLEAIASEIAERNGYTPMEGVDAYSTTGDSDDWLHADTGCLPFTIELATEFQPPISQVEAICQNNLEAAIYAIGIADNPERALLPDWTFMAYMSADSESSLDKIDEAALDDLNEMEVSGSSDDVNIIVLHDGPANGDSKLYRILKDPDGLNETLVSEILNDYGNVIDPVTDEAVMSEPSTLESFVAWTTENYPAQNYFLDIWGHGKGLLGGVVSDNSVTMPTWEIGTALTDFDLDVVGFDACSMGHFETAYELMGIADIFIGSEAEEPLAGWDYEQTLSRLAENPNICPHKMAEHVVSDYLERNSATDWITQAAVDLYVYEKVFLPRLDDMLNVTFDFVYQDYDLIWEARNFTDDSYYDTFGQTNPQYRSMVDLFEYLGNLQELAIAEPFGDRIQSLEEIEDLLIVKSGHGSTHAEADTMSVYFPNGDNVLSDLSPLYSNVGFSSQQWDEFLLETKNPTMAPRLTAATAPALDNITGPYVFSIELDSVTGTIVELKYRLNGGSWQTQTMSPNSPTYTCTLPGQSNGTVIDYYYQASFNGTEITEPYEMKWTGNEYYQITVLAYCDVAISGLSVTPESNLHNDTAITVSVTCINHGPQDASVNLSAALTSGIQTISLGSEEFALASGSTHVANFSWIGLNGSWLASISIAVYEKEDINITNQESAIWLNVTPLSSVITDDSLGDWVYVLVFLAIMAFIPIIALVFTFKKARQRRTISLARMLRSARQTIATAEEFDVDTSAAYILLAKAEAAFSNGDFAESERLANKAKEKAMLAVGERKK